MLWFIQVSVVSLIIIFVIHNLYTFFKETLTVPKIKDMVKRPQQRYDTLFRELRNQVAENANANANASANSIVNSSSNADDMKNELKRYLMDLNSSHTTHTTHTTQSTHKAQTIQDPQPQSDFIEMGSIYK
jgi:hypothetical protein